MGPLQIRDYWLSQSLLLKVVSRDGTVLEENQPRLKQVISPQTAYLVTNLLTSVVQEGTGRRARVLKRPCAGKTGTTNDVRDAWFIGYTPDIHCRYLGGV